MPGDPFKHVQPGQRLQFPAALYNGVADLVANNRRQLSMNPGTPGGLEPGRLYVKNTTDDDLDQFAVLGISDALIDPADNPDGFAARAMVEGVEPAAEHLNGLCVVLVEPVAAGEIGVAVAQGVLPVKLEIAAAGDRYADAAVGSTDELVSGPTGVAEILWAEPGTGTGKWALVRVGGNRPEAVVVRVQGSGGYGRRWYDGNIMVPPAGDVNPMVAAGSGANGTVGAPCIILNLAPEDGGADGVTPWLSGGDHPGTIRSVQSDGTPVVVIEAYQDVVCPTGEGA
ncbi:MAG: hypothetical protein JWO31_793 [Phycisphaerales bacterium]|nr:hypothetical protein [Phycisphaerales bacterium]